MRWMNQFDRHGARPTPARRVFQGAPDGPNATRRETVRIRRDQTNRFTTRTTANPRLAKSKSARANTRTMIAAIRKRLLIE